MFELEKFKKTGVMTLNKLHSSNFNQRVTIR